MIYQEAIGLMSDIRSGAWDISRYITGTDALRIPGDAYKIREPFISMPQDSELSEDELHNVETMQERFRILYEETKDAVEEAEERQRRERQKSDDRRQQIKLGEEFDENKWYYPNLQTTAKFRKWIDITEKFQGEDPIIRERLPEIRELSESGKFPEEEISAMVRAKVLKSINDVMQMPEIIPFSQVLYHGSSRTYDIPQAHRAPVDSIYTPKAFYLTSDWTTAVEYAVESSFITGMATAPRVYEVQVNAQRMADCSECKDRDTVAFVVLQAYEDGLDGVLIPATTSPTRGLDPVPEVMLFHPDGTSKILEVHVGPLGYGDEYHKWSRGMEDVLVL